MTLWPTATHRAGEGVFENGNATNNNAGSVVLAAEWAATVDAVAAQVTAHQPHIVGVQIGDELVDGGLSVANLSAVADRLRAKLPPSVFIYTNEGFRYENPCNERPTGCKDSGAGPTTCKNNRCYPAVWSSMPASIDYISLDGYANDPNEAAFAREQYERCSLTPRAILK